MNSEISNYMTLKKKCVLALFTGAYSCTAFSAGVSSSPKDLAFPGYSGFLNVPSATVVDHGQADVQWSDQGFVGGQYGHYKNVSGLFGVLPFVEVGGRVIWAQTQSNCYTTGCGGIRDLSANVKVQAPFIPKNWFTLALGAQDLGGETGNFKSVYVAAGKELGPVEFTLGYADTREANRYLDGAFGAVSYRPVPWFGMIAEYDSMDARGGFSVATPQGWLPAGAQLKAKVLAYDEGDTDNDRHFASVGISIPFGNARSKQQRMRPVEPPARPEPNIEPQAVSQAERPPESQPEEAAQELAGSDVGSEPGKNARAAKVLGKQLVAEGYDRVRTASRNGTLFVQWENNVYNRDERESVAEVAQKARAVVAKHQTVELTLLNQGLPVVTRTLASTSPSNRMQGEFSQYGAFEADKLDWDFEGSYGPHWKPRLTLSPSISSGVATEYGVWDASVALSSKLDFSLWPGALASARYDAEIYHTEDFDEGGVFYNSRQRTDLVEAEIQQTLRLHPQLYTSIHAGRYALDYNGVINETLWMSPSGNHGVGFIGGSFKHVDNSNWDKRQSLAQYTYYNANRDVQFTASAGRFFSEDTGFRLDSRFWFGDYAITLQYKNTDAQFVALGWVIPLTPVKNKSFRYLQIKGDADFNYAVQTRVNEDTNDVGGGAGIVKSSNPLRKVYFNRGRLTNPQ